LLRTLGCSEMQGYLFSAAKPAAEIVALFASHYEAAAQPTSGELGEADGIRAAKSPAGRRLLEGAS
jgi:hypothetical protein